MGTPAVCLHTGMRVNVQQPRYMVTWYAIHPYVCGCIEQMLQQTNDVRSYKPEQA